MAYRLHHVNILVNNIDEALNFYADAFGVERPAIGGLSREGIKSAPLPTGEVTLVLIEPTDPQGAAAKSLDRRGEGLYSIALEVDDLGMLLEQMRESGVQLLGGQPGIETKYAWVHPRSSNGVLIELRQK